MGAELNPDMELDTAAATLRTRSDTVCQTNVSRRRRATYGYDQRVGVLGSKGMVQTQNQTENGVSLATSEGITTDPLKNFFIDRYADVYVHEIDSFLQVMAGTDSNYPDLIARYSARYLGMAALDSARTGQPVSIEF